LSTDTPGREASPPDGPDGSRSCPVHFDRHAPDYRHHFEEITRDLQGRCPVAWSETYDGHWVASGNREVLALARAHEVISNDHDPFGRRRGYKGISIPPPPDEEGVRGGFLEMDPPEQKSYRDALNPYLSPAAIRRWIPFLEEVTRACLDERIEDGRIDFVDDLANIVPAVFTLAMMGIPIQKWTVYCEPAHASVYTPPDSPDMERVKQERIEMGMDLFANVAEVKENSRPGLVDALLRMRLDGEPAPDMDILGALALLIGGGFDTTTALTAHSLEWLGEHPDERDRLRTEFDTLIDSATEEFLRYYTPAPGDGRTFSADCEVAGQDFKEGERLWLSWAMANRDPSVFPDPDKVDLERPANRHASFGLGIHRCIGSNVARTVFKLMVRQVLERMPEFVCDAEGAEHYETIGVIQGMRHLPATFPPGKRRGPGLDETLDRLQRLIDDQGWAQPITIRKEPTSGLDD
jgi:cytochrome P450